MTHISVHDSTKKILEEIKCGTGISLVNLSKILIEFAAKFKHNRKHLSKESLLLIKSKSKYSRK